MTTPSLNGNFAKEATTQTSKNNDNHISQNESIDESDVSSVYTLNMELDDNSFLDHDLGDFSESLDDSPKKPETNILLSLTDKRSATTSIDQRKDAFVFNTVGKFATLNPDYKFDDETAYKTKVKNAKNCCILLYSNDNIRIFTKVDIRVRKESVLYSGKLANFEVRDKTFSTLPLKPSFFSLNTFKNLVALMNNTSAGHNSCFMESIENLKPADYIVCGKNARCIDIVEVDPSSFPSNLVGSNSLDNSVFNVYTYEQLLDIISSSTNDKRYGGEYGDDGILVPGRKFMEDLYEIRSPINVSKVFEKFPNDYAFKTCAMGRSQYYAPNLAMNLRNLPKGLVKSFFFFEFFKRAYKVPVTLIPSSREMKFYNKNGITYSHVTFKLLHEKYNEFLQEENISHSNNVPIKTVPYKMFRKHLLTLHYNYMLYKNEIVNKRLIFPYYIAPVYGIDVYGKIIEEAKLEHDVMIAADLPQSISSSGQKHNIFETTNHSLANKTLRNKAEEYSDHGDVTTTMNPQKKMKK